MDEPPADYPFTDDFVGEDHRTNTLWPRRVGKDEFAGATSEWWRIGGARPLLDEWHAELAE